MENTQETPQGRGNFLAMAGLALVLFLVSLDQTVVGVSMPKIIADLNGFALYAWVATIYLLAETIALPIVGKLGDIYGRKWITIGGIALFIGASALCGLAPSMIWLIAFRGIQGLGGGTVMATVFTIVADIYPDLRDRARYQGFLFSVFALSSVVGPPLGGWITDALSWRWVFYVNIPLGAFALVVLPKVLPQSPRQPEARIDYWGAISVTIAIIGLLLGLELTNIGFAWTSPQVLGGLIVSVVALAIFIPIEMRVSDPIMPFSMFRDRNFLAVSAILFLFGISMFGIILYIPLYLQAVIGLSASQSGLVMLPMSLTMPTIGIVIGQMIAKAGKMRPFLIAGVAIMSIGILLLTTLQVTTSYWLVGGYLFITALGMGTVMPVTTLIVQSSVSHKMLGVATSATQFIRSIGSTIGTALIGMMITSSYLTGLASQAPTGTPEPALAALESPNALISEEALQSLSDLMAQVPDGSGLLEGLLAAAREGLVFAIHRSFIVMLGTVLLALACTFFVTRLKLADSPAPADSPAMAPH